MKATSVVTEEDSRKNTRKNNYVMRFMGYGVCTLVVIVTILIPSMASVSSDSEASVCVQPTTYKNEAITSIREITLQLILIAVGVYALVGGFIAGKDKGYCCKKTILWSFIFLAVSILCGLTAYGSLIYNLSEGAFRVTGTVRYMALGQWLSFFVGGILLIQFLIKNIN